MRYDKSHHGNHRPTAPATPATTKPKSTPTTPIRLSHYEYGKSGPMPPHLLAKVIAHHEAGRAKHARRR